MPELGRWLPLSTPILAPFAPTEQLSSLLHVGLQKDKPPPGGQDGWEGQDQPIYMFPKLLHWGPSCLLPVPRDPWMLPMSSSAASSSTF